jgi:formylglycine-generating enzyme required for sulfatase activity
MSQNRPPVVTPGRGGAPAGASQPPPAAYDVKLVRTALDEALDSWWRRGQLPPPALLRDGLLVLEAGHPLEEAQVSLLLRAALLRRKGMLTALKHQTDPERTAVILADALLAAPPANLSLQELDQLRREDDGSAAWLAALPSALVEETGSADAGRRQRAAELLEELRAGWPVPPASSAKYRVSGSGSHAAALAAGTAHQFGGRYEDSDDGQYEEWDESTQGAWLAPPVAAMPVVADHDLAPGWQRISWFKSLAVLVPIALVALALLWWRQQSRLDGMVFVPAGAYPVSAESSGGMEQVELAAYAVDRDEVTVGDYRKCVAAGRCRQPPVAAGSTRPNYLLDPAFSGYPVVNVDWRSAGDYCAWSGKRLPTAVEWEVAAGYAPSTQRQYLFPWGDQFQVQRANSRLTGIDDTQVVGSYRPIGDSPWRASDMAGNVAEWTATNVGKAPAAADVDAPDRFLVKGGSFRDSADALAVAAAEKVEATTFASWLGFRCAVNVSDDLAAARAASPATGPK